MEKEIQLFIEALIFASEHPVTKLELLECLKKVYVHRQEEITEELISSSVENIIVKYIGENFAFELRKIGGGYQFLTKAPYHEGISVLLNLKEKKRLSTAALETLSIIAYRQPITKTEIEQVRGVSADYSIHKLLEKELIIISGKKDSPGNPVMYSVSQSFLDYFGINDTTDLPQLKDIENTEENSIGVNPELEA
ncbi:MAG: SMC-Scp complex subunit ScpB [Bacteroidota bacterium]